MDDIAAVRLRALQWREVERRALALTQSLVETLSSLDSVYMHTIAKLLVECTSVQSEAEYIASDSEQRLKSLEQAPDPGLQGNPFRGEVLMGRGTLTVTYDPPKEPDGSSG